MVWALHFCDVTTHHFLTSLLLTVHHQPPCCCSYSLCFPPLGFSSPCLFLANQEGHCSIKSSLERLPFLSYHLDPTSSSYSLSHHPALFFSSMTLFYASVSCLLTVFSTRMRTGTLFYSLLYLQCLKLSLAHSRCIRNPC